MLLKSADTRDKGEEQVTCDSNSREDSKYACPAVSREEFVKAVCAPMLTIPNKQLQEGPLNCRAN